MNESGCYRFADAVVAGPDGYAYVVPRGVGAAFRVPGGLAHEAEGSLVSGNSTVPGKVSVDKRAQEILGQLPQMPVYPC